ncbi:MAG: response regulator [Lachnospiraceae bacterium]|nr:response regulator [Lachnospiraceae bacterium]
MKIQKFKSLRLHAVMIATYAFFIVGLFVLSNMNFSTPLKIDLNDSAVFLREGAERNYMIDPRGENSPWIDLTGKSWSIYKSGLVDEDKQRLLTPTDKPVKYFTYMLEFEVSTEQIAFLRRNSICPGLHLASISDNWEIYLNGNLVKRNMFLDEDGSIAVHKNVVSYSVPFDKSYLLEGVNKLMIYVVCAPNYSDAGLYFAGDYYIDEYEGIQAQNNQIFLLFLSGISIFMAFYNFLIFLNSKKERHYLHFTCVQLLLGIYIFVNTPYTQSYFADSQVVKAIEFMCVCIMPIFAILFTKNIARQRLRLVWKVIIGIQIVVAALIPFVGLQASVDLLLIGECFVLVDLIYGMVLSFRVLLSMAEDNAKSSGNDKWKEFVSVTFRSVHGNAAIGLSIVFISAIIGVITSSIIGSDQNHVILGLFAFVISVSYALSNDVIETKQQIAGQNELLEVKVTSRTKELEEQTQLALMASAAKTRFLATMSHEIRTPMNAIIGISQIELARNDLDEQFKDALHRIYSSGRGLLGIINDILDLSKAESGKLELNIAEYDVPSLLNDIVQLNMVRIGSKPIAFALEVDPTIPLKLIGDELRIKQIMNNILSNAFKYTQAGSVKMKVAVAGEERQPELLISVADTGQGIRKEDIEKLFDDYTRFNSETNKATEGTGLGMSITGKLVKLMNGEIRVESEFGKGSTFVVRFPQECNDLTPIGEALATQLTSFEYRERHDNQEEMEYIPMPYGKVLVVDDVETNLFVAAGLIAPYRLRYDQAISGFEAIEKVEAGNQYDIIFMDHMMPQMDGIETVRRLRAMGYQLPIVALTANAIVGNEAMFRQNGFDDFISKPISAKQLDITLQRYIKERHKEEAKEIADARNELQLEMSSKGGDTKSTEGTGRAVPAKKPVKKKSVDPRLKEVFIRDSRNAVRVLTDTLSQSNLELFAITAHGMKSACANVKESKLSLLASELETAAKNQEKAILDEKLPLFLDALRAVIRSFEPPKETIVMQEDVVYLAQKMKEIKTACEEYEPCYANAAIQELKQKQWKSETQKVLDEISGCLLHADFEEAAKICEQFEQHGNNV